MVALILLVLVTLLGSGNTSPREANSVLTSKAAPELDAVSTDGAPVRLASLEGKVVLLNFWATWCSPCRMELPDFVALHKDYKDKGLVLLGGVVNDNMTKAAAYAKENEMHWPQFAVTRELAQAYGGLGAVPTTVLIDKEGVVNAVFVGVITRADIESKIKSLL